MKNIYEFYFPQGITGIVKRRMIISFLILASLFVQSLGAVSDEQLAQKKEELQKAVYYYQHCYSKRAERGLGLIAAVAGAASRHFFHRGADVTAFPFSILAVGFGIAYTRALWMKPWDRGIINKRLKVHGISKIQELSEEQAMLIIAANEKDLILMRELIADQSDFLKRDGVWNALVHLYFYREPTNEDVSNLKEMLTANPAFTNK